MSNQAKKEALEATAAHTEVTAATASILSTVQSGLRETLERRLVRAAESGDLVEAAEIIGILNEVVAGQQKMQVYNEELAHLRGRNHATTNAYLNDRIRLQKEIFGDEWGKK